MMSWGSFGLSFVSHQPKPNAIGQSSAPADLAARYNKTATARLSTQRITYHGMPNLGGSGLRVSLIGSSCSSSEFMSSARLAKANRRSGKSASSDSIRCCP